MRLRQGYSNSRLMDLAHTQWFLRRWLFFHRRRDIPWTLVFVKGNLTARKSWALTDLTSRQWPWLWNYRIFKTILSSIVIEQFFKFIVETYLKLLKVVFELIKFVMIVSGAFVASFVWFSNCNVRSNWDDICSHLKDFLMFFDNIVYAHVLTFISAEDATEKGLLFIFLVYVLF